MEKVYNDSSLSIISEKSWEEIIPEERRREMEDEEMQQQLMELNLPPRQRKQVIRVG